jgi:hypothetical protein
MENITMKMIRQITLDEINRYFYEENGQLKWKIRKSTCNRVGDVAEYYGGKYGMVTINYKKYLVHRILYQIYHQIQLMPDNLDIDHIDGNTKNNLKSNLRLATKTQNMHNAKKGKNNTSGYKNIYRAIRWYKNTNKLKENWKVSIRVNDKIYQRKFPYTDHGLKMAIDHRNIKILELHKEFTNLG